MVYVHLAPGFEEVEALAVVDVLRRAAVDVRLVSVCGEKRVVGAHDIAVEADLLFEQADYSGCEMIVLPGGMPGTTGLKAHKGLEEQILAFAEEGKWLAAVCAAPMILGGLGLLKGRQALIYPGMEGHLAGAVVAEGLKVVQDGRIITSKGPGTALEFALKLAEVLRGKETADRLRADMIIG